MILVDLQSENFGASQGPLGGVVGLGVVMMGVVVAVGQGVW
jgi:hypothetical protein